MPVQPRPIADRLWPKIDVRGPDDCWLWTASTDTRGYGQIGRGRRGMKMARAHRVAYELTVGPIPEGLTLDHLCRVRRCCNPRHLEPVTQRENTLRGNGIGVRNRAKTHCPQGHPYAGRNLLLYIIRGSPSRRCRECNRSWVQEYRKRARNN